MNTEVQQSPSPEDSDQEAQEDIDWQVDNNLSFGENLDEMDAPHHNIPHHTHSPRNDLAMRRERKPKLLAYFDKCFESCLYPFMQNCCRNKFVWFIIFQFFLLFLRVTRNMESYIAFFIVIIPIFIILVYIIYRYCKQSMMRDHRRPRRPEYSMHHMSPHHVDERLLQQLVFQTLRNRLELLRDSNSGDPRFPTREDFDFRSDIRNMIRELQSFDERILAVPGRELHGLSQEEIDRIPIESYIKGKEMDYDVCSICIDEFKDDEKVRRLTCGHQFHIGCVDQWLKQSTSCPNCKSELRTGGNQNHLDEEMERQPNFAIIEIPDFELNERNL